MIAAILSLLGSSAVGSLIGGVFAWLNRKTDLDAKRLDLEHERSRWAHELAVKDKDLQLIQAEAAGKAQVAIIEADSAIEAQRMRSIAEVDKADQITADELGQAGKMRWLLVLAMAFRKTIRPLATTILVAAALWLNYVLAGRLADGWEAMTLVQRYDAAMQAVAWVFGQASACLGYWFVSRNSAR